MADQKVTDRVALSAGADPINDVLPIVDVSAGVSGSKKITINDLFTGWGMTPAGAALVKALTPADQKNLLGVSIEFDPTITGLTGGGPTKLDGAATLGSPDNRLRMVYENGRFSIYMGKVGGVAESVPHFINADDQSAGYYWELVNLTVNVLRSLAVVMTSDDKTRTVTLGPGSIDESSNPYLQVQNTAGPVYTVFFPSDGGNLSLERAMSRYLSPLNGTTFFVGGSSDRFISVSSISTLDACSLTFPNNGFCRNGQEVVFHTKSALTNLVFHAGTGNIFEGPIPTSMTPGQKITFVYSSNDATWIATAN